MALADIIRRAAQTINAVHGVDVVYRRGDYQVACRATRRESFARQEQGDGTWGVIRVDDWQIIADDLVDADGKPITPNDGDEILFVDLGKRLTFLALPFAGQPSARFTDSSCRVWLIHTKQLADVPNFSNLLCNEQGIPLTNEAGILLCLEL